MSKYAVIYSGIVVDVLLEIFIFAEDWFSDEVIILDTDDWNQWSWINFCQPRNLLSLLVILQSRHKTVSYMLLNCYGKYLKTDIM